MTKGKDDANELAEIKDEITALKSAFTQRLDTIEEVLKGILENIHEIKSTNNQPLRPADTAETDSEQEDIYNPGPKFMERYPGELEKYLQLSETLEREMRESDRESTTVIGASIMSFEEWMSNGKPENLVLDE